MVASCDPQVSHYCYWSHCFRIHVSVCQYIRGKRVFWPNPKWAKIARATFHAYMFQPYRLDTAIVQCKDGLATSSLWFERLSALSHVFSLFVVCRVNLDLVSRSPWIYAVRSLNSLVFSVLSSLVDFVFITYNCCLLLAIDAVLCVKTAAPVWIQ